MLKTVFIHFFVLMGFTSAYAAPVFQLKDVSYNMINADTVEVVSKEGKVLLEKVDSTHFKINSQVVTYSSNDSFDQLQMKVEKAYKASLKKSASLDELILPRAHAIFWLVPAMMGGMLGMALGQSTCQSSEAQPAAQ